MRGVLLIAALAASMAACAQSPLPLAPDAAEAASRQQAEYAKSQKDAEARRDAHAQALRDAYWNCARASAVTFRGQGTDRNLSIEQAFAACQTEEFAIRQLFAPAGAIGTAYADRAIVNSRVAIKADLLLTLP